MQGMQAARLPLQQLFQHYRLLGFFEEPLEAWVAALESGFNVEPWPTISRALSDFEIIFDSNVGRRTSN
jgi:hypothetical protein